MDIDKELEALFDDPLLDVSEKEKKLLDITLDMRKVIAKKKADYVAQHKLCENFDDYKPLFAKVHRELKQTTLNKYTYLDESDGKRYLRRYDAIRFFVGYHKDRECALVQVKDITYNAGIVEYHLGLILEVLNKN